MRLETASSLARSYCEQTQTAESTYWHNLRGLRRKGYLSYGEGKTVELTEEGFTLARQLSLGGGNETD